MKCCRRLKRRYFQFITHEENSVRSADYQGKKRVFRFTLYAVPGEW